MLEQVAILDPASSSQWSVSKKSVKKLEIFFGKCLTCLAAADTIL
jgi:hypothetical protein